MKVPLLLSLLLGTAVAPVLAGPLEDAVKTLTQVGREGSGNEVATQAWTQVVASGPKGLMPLLAQSGSGSTVADNWVRLAGNTIVAQALEAKRPLPLDALEAFLTNTAHSEAARLLAFDLLQQADANRAQKLERTFGNDPVQKLRRGAVAFLLTSAASKSGEEAKKAYQEALSVARDEDQTKIVSEALKKLGVDVDIPKHFGFLTQWQVIGPFDNTKGAGFQTAFPPETEVVLDKSYVGKSGPVKWQPAASKDEYGKLNLNETLTALKEATAYAVTTFESGEAREAELRLGCKNAWKVWLNGELLFARDEYHRGQRMDQYRLKGRLRKGSNTILVKCCQNEQTESWTVEWEFQLRVCDGTGTALLSSASKR